MTETERQTASKLTVEGDANGTGDPLSTVQLSETQFRAFLLSLSKQAGSVAELARRLDVTGQFIGGIINGSRLPGPKLLSKLNAKAERVYTVEIARDDV